MGHDAGQNTFDEANVGYNHAQVSTDSDVDNNRVICKRRKTGITSHELSEIALAKNIKSRTELLAQQQKVSPWSTR